MQVSVIRKYHDQIQQTNHLCREEEQHNTNSHKTLGRQLLQSNQLSLPRQYDCKTYKGHKVMHIKTMAKHRTSANNEKYIKQ